MRTFVRFCGLLVSLLVLLPASASAQTVCPDPCTLKEGQSFGVQFDPPADLTGVSGFRLYLDDQQIGGDIPVGTTTVSNLVAPASGPHTLKVSAFNQDHETFSSVVNFAARVEEPVPGAPGNIRIVITMTVAQNGEMKVTVTGTKPIQQE